MNNGAETISWRIGYAEQGLEGPASADMRFWRSIGSIGAFLFFPQHEWDGDRQHSLEMSKAGRDDQIRQKHGQ
jgi:hypothetical protein